MTKRPTAGAGGKRRSRGAQRLSETETPGGDLGFDVPTDAAAPIDNTRSHEVAQPIFAQPTATVDPTEFVVKHANDAQAYKTLDALNRQHALQPLPFPAPRGLPEPVLALAQVLGARGQAIVDTALAAGRAVFHSVGDTGNTRGPDPQNAVADKMIADFAEADPADVPLFWLHLGDVIYNFGEALYYYDQFYDPYRDYPAPILALAGNHDGMIAPGTHAITLDAYLANFCADTFRITPEAGGLSRTAQIQPGVFFTVEAPFVRILALYSNTLEDPGVISTEGGAFPELNDSQLDYLRAALTRVKEEKYAGALILAHHHPAYTAGAKHGWSIKLREECDALFEETGVWPHAVLSAHAHNYQRFTRAWGEREVPYVIAGNGGHGLGKLSTKRAGPLRVPMVIDGADDGDHVRLENYDDQDYGYLRIVADAATLRIEYHPASDGTLAKTPDDVVTVDLAAHRLA